MHSTVAAMLKKFIGERTGPAVLFPDGQATLADEHFSPETTRSHPGCNIVGPMRRVLLLPFLVFFVRVIPRAGSSPSGSDAKAFVNGKWFTGQEFESATFYAVDGILTKRKPSGPVETVDLQGGLAETGAL